jgi:hypothetical protein
MIERMIKKLLLCMTCMLCLTFYCNWDDDDDHHHHDHDDDDDYRQSSLRQDEQDKGERRENLPALAFLCEENLSGK